MHTTLGTRDCHDAEIPRASDFVTSHSQRSRSISDRFRLLGIALRAMNAMRTASGRPRQENIVTLLSDGCKLAQLSVIIV